MSNDTYHKRTDMDVEADVLKDLEAAKAQSIKPGSPEMEAYLGLGYPDIGSREHANELIAARKKNPAEIPYEVMQRALAYLAALDWRPPK
jgi:hypothetical protein